MSVSDGTLTILAKNQSVMEKVQEKVLHILSSFSALDDRFLVYFPPGPLHGGIT